MGIRWKLMLTYTFIALIVLLAAGIYVSRTLKGQYLSRIEGQLRCDADLAGAYVLEAMGKGPLTHDADSLVDEIGKRLNVRVTLMDLSGKVWGDSELDGDDLADLEDHGDRLEILEARDRGAGMNIRHSFTLDTDMMYLAKPIEKDGEKLGFIRLALPLVQIDQALQGLRQSLGVAFLLGLILAVLISYATARRLTRPINTISRIAGKMADGDFSIKAAVRSNDEIGLLARTINQMSSQLDQTIGQITTERDRLQGVLGGMREGVMLTDRDGRIVMTNEAFQSIFSITTPVEGATPIEATRDARLHEAVDRGRKGGREVIDEIELYLPAHRILYVHVVPLGLPERLTGTVAVLYDVTQLKNLERVRKDFVANVSHELNTPLAAIRGYAETLQGKALEHQETARQFLQIIARHADRMTKLVSDLLALSKWESDGYRPTFAPVHLRSLVNNSLETFHDIIGKKGLNLQVDIPEPCSVRADEKGLEQVFINLLDNAVKFTPEGGRIAISAAEEDAFMKIAVSDTGIGIPSNDISRIFERFYRVDKDRSRELGGTGLGLSIVKHIVQAHGGQVWEESQIGHGSTFYLTIPKA